MSKKVNKEVKKELIFKVKCRLDKNGNKYLIDVKGTNIEEKEYVFSNIIFHKDNVWDKYPLTNFKVDKEYDIKVSGYKIEDNRVALFVKNELVELLP